MSHKINEALINIRKYHKMSQSHLAISLEISRSYLSEIESGKKEITLRLLKRYSAYFDLPLSSIVQLSDEINCFVRTKEQKKIIKKIIEWCVE